ncbi:MAG: prealbumin-like fold domain-containing protein [Longispora sp.]|nr:prealbumin-like fold domain-containing protein [Longispora sp. (in: high G+C Gram-positive bacteria)]
MTVAPPTGEPVQGVSGEWRVKVTAASGAPVADVDVSLAAEGIAETITTVRTDGAGSARVVLTPKTEIASLGAAVQAPSGKPMMRRPARAVSQKIGVISRLAPVQGSAGIHAQPSGQLVLSKTISGDLEKKSVAGAILAVSDMDGKELAKVTMTHTPRELTLPAQPVVITEESAPEGLVAPIAPTTVRVEAGKSTKVAMSDHVQVTLIKRDLVEQDKTLAGAEFHIYADAEREEMVWVATTGDDGTAVITSGLSAGTYWVVETKAPDGYALNTVARQLVVPAESRPVELTLFNAKPVQRGTHKTPVTAITAGRTGT